MKPIRLSLATGLAASWLCAAPAFAAPPRILPDHDVAVTYRVTVPNQSDGTYLVRYQAASQRADVTGLSGEGAGFGFLLDIPAGTGDVIMPQTHTIVPLPDLADIIQRVTNAQGARFTRLGSAVIAGQSCTRYLILSPKGDGTACLTKGGVVLAAAAKDSRGSMKAEALSVSDTPQPPQDFSLPAGYTTLNLPPSMLQQLLGH